MHSAWECIGLTGEHVVDLTTILGFKCIALESALRWQESGWVIWNSELGAQSAFGFQQACSTSSLDWALKHFGVLVLGPNSLGPCSWSPSGFQRACSTSFSSGLGTWLYTWCPTPFAQMWQRSWTSEWDMGSLKRLWLEQKPMVIPISLNMNWKATLLRLRMV